MRFLENCCCKSFRKFSDSSKLIRAGQSVQSITMLKIDSNVNVYEHFQNYWERACSGINISKATGEVPAFYNFSFVYSHVLNEALLEISRNSFLTRVAGLQSTDCNSTKNKLLTKFRNFQGSHFFKTLMEGLFRKLRQRTPMNVSGWRRRNH